MRNTGELHHLPFRKRIADLNGTVVVQANDIPGDRLFHVTAIARKKGDRISNFYIFG